MKTQVKLWQRNSQLPHFYLLIFLQKVKKTTKEAVKGSVHIVFQLLQFIFCKVNVHDRRGRIVFVHSFCVCFCSYCFTSVDFPVDTQGLTQSQQKIIPFGVIDPIKFYKPFHLLLLHSKSVLAMLHHFGQITSLVCACF